VKRWQEAAPEAAQEASHSGNDRPFQRLRSADHRRRKADGSHPEGYEKSQPPQPGEADQADPHPA